MAALAQDPSSFLALSQDLVGATFAFLDSPVLALASATAAEARLAARPLFYKLLLKDFPLIAAREKATCVLDDGPEWGPRWAHALERRARRAITRERKLRRLADAFEAEEEQEVVAILDDKPEDISLYIRLWDGDVMRWEGTLGPCCEGHWGLTANAFHLTPDALDWPELWTLLRRIPEQNDPAEVNRVLDSFYATLLLIRKSDGKIAKVMNKFLLDSCVGSYGEPEQPYAFGSGDGISSLLDSASHSLGISPALKMDTIHDAENPQILCFAFNPWDEKVSDGLDVNEIMKMLPRLSWE
jgi:hypothetical protein